MGKKIKGKELASRFSVPGPTQLHMDRYVHVTNDSMLKAVSLFEESSPTSLV